jgi:hypothetical protein
MAEHETRKFAARTGFASTLNGYGYSYPTYNCIYAPVVYARPAYVYPVAQPAVAVSATQTVRPAATYVGYRPASQTVPATRPTGEPPVYAVNR